MILLEMALQQMINYALLFVFFIVIAWMLAEFKGMKDEIREKLGINNETIKLRLHAYERLSLFAERAALKNMVSRTPSAGVNVVNYQLTLLEELRTEYEYNISQQVYISKEMWKAVSNLKDQNAFIINQIAAMLPQNAPAYELSKRILEYSANKDAELSPIVLDALQIEAKRLM